MTAKAESPRPVDSPPPEEQAGESVVASDSVEATDVESEAPAVEFRHVHFSFDDQKVLDDLSFVVERGEIKIILSGSGGGKSTILKLILGLLKPDAGQIFAYIQEFIRGTEIDTKDAEK